MRAALLVLAALLAGCAGEPGPLVAPEPTFTTGPDVPMREPPALTWIALTAGAFQILPGGADTRGLTVPPHVILVAVNLTLEQGGATGLRVQLASCDWRRETPFVAVGQTVSADCGSLAPATEELTLTAYGGAMMGALEVVALVCAPDPARSACPNAAPVPSG